MTPEQLKAIEAEITASILATLRRNGMRSHPDLINVYVRSVDPKHMPVDDELATGPLNVLAFFRERAR